MNSTNYFNGRISGSLQFLSAGYQVGRPLVPEGFVVCFLLVAAWGSMAAAVQPNSPGELSENILQNLSEQVARDWPPHLVRTCWTWVSINNLYRNRKIKKTYVFILIPDSYGIKRHSENIVYSAMSRSTTLLLKFPSVSLSLCGQPTVKPLGRTAKRDDIRTANDVLMAP